LSAHRDAGQIVVAIVDNEFTVKRLTRERGQYVLKPENKAYPPSAAESRARDFLA
jgi:SOS-response transcriptional repressor LexA